jgi:putative transcriptional regulator
VSGARGRLLLAGPQLVEPTFARTVVLVLEHSGDGAMGLVLNRPTGVPVGAAAPQLAGVAGDDAHVHSGGPVQPQGIVVLAEFDDPAVAALVVLDDVGVVAAGTELDDLPGLVRRARVFAGHAGWGPGQLDDELGREDWIVADAHRDDAFRDDAGALWPGVLRRMGGRYALLAQMPADPSVN